MKRPDSPEPRQLTLIERRLVEAACKTLDVPNEALFQHSALCQVCLPYREPKDGDGEPIREWERTQGQLSLFIEAGRARSPSGEWVKLGLPYGPKPRLILSHLNAEALRTKSPDIEVEHSLTAFIKRLRLDTNGYTIRGVKDQLARLAASRMLWSFANGEAARTGKEDIIKQFDIWFEKDARQRVMWPSVIRLDPAYFESLQQHAVPLHPEALAALSHSAMGLDIYAWLAQRLHRVPANAPQFVTWKALQEQFGQEYTRLRKFREVFNLTLSKVRAVYRDARIETTEAGLTLHHSFPPVYYRRPAAIA